MRRSDVLIYEARRISRNSANADGTYSISDDEVLQYLNDAQDRLQNKISALKNGAKIFVTQEFVSLVANQEAYSLSGRLLLNKQIENVEYSATGLVGDYVRLVKFNFINRMTDTTNYPWGYIKRGGQILIQPTPSTSTGTLRITYEAELDDLDIPRGVISTVTGGTSTQFTTLTFSALANSYESTTPGWSNIQYFCVSTVTGARRCYNVLVGSYDTGTNIITPSPSPFVFTSADTTPVAADIVTFNKWTTTFSGLPDNCERYLIHYAALELFKKDSSNDTSSQEKSLALIEADILESMKSQTSEVEYIPQENGSDWF